MLSGHQRGHPLYYRTECQWEPTLSELTDGDFGRSPARWRIVNGRSTAPMVDPHSGCFPRRFAGSPVSVTSSVRGRRQPGEIEKTSDRAPSTALTSAIRLNDALSVRDDISSAMRCRKKNQRCAVVSHLGVTQLYSICTVSGREWPYRASGILSMFRSNRSTLLYINQSTA